MAAPDLTDAIAAQAVEPVTSAADGQSASARPIADLILADQYLAGKTARKQRRRGILFAKQIPPGPLSDAGGSIGGYGAPFGGGLQ